MSTPLVGSSRISTFGSSRSQRAMMIFCCMPPEKLSRFGIERAVPSGSSRRPMQLCDPARRACHSRGRSRDGRRDGRAADSRAPTGPARSICRRRSSATKPMPARIACAGVRGANGWPSRRTSPPARGRSPKIVSTVSDRPAPTRPPSPRISPRCRSKETSRTSGGARRPRTDRTGSPRASGGPRDAA